MLDAVRCVRGTQAVIRYIEGTSMDENGARRANNQLAAKMIADLKAGKSIVIPMNEMGESAFEVTIIDGLSEDGEFKINCAPEPSIAPPPSKPKTRGEEITEAMLVIDDRRFFAAEIDRAIAEEREACAKIAEAVTSDARTWMLADGRNFNARFPELVSEAIRTRK